MTAKGIAAFRKKYAHIANMDPNSLREFEGQLIKYKNEQQGAIGRTYKEHAKAEVNPALREAQTMLADVQQRLKSLR